MEKRPREDERKPFAYSSGQIPDAHCESGTAIAIAAGRRLDRAARRVVRSSRLAPASGGRSLPAPALGRRPVSTDVSARWLGAADALFYKLLDNAYRSTS
jgi:hypothetical protein